MHIGTNPKHSPLLVVTEGEEASGIFLEFAEKPQVGKDCVSVFI